MAATLRNASVLGVRIAPTDMEDQLVVQGRWYWGF